MPELPGCHLVPGHDKAACTRTAPAGYCAPKRCYCGGCPWFVPIEVLATNTPDRYTAFDRAAILSSTGRRANLADYRHAQAQKAARDG